MLRAPRRMAATVAASLAGFLAPLRESRCVSCAVPVPAKEVNTAFGTALCPACTRALLRRTAGYCTRCGNLFAAADATPAPCGECLATPRPWERFFFHGVYQGVLRDLILRFKSGHELPLGALLGGLLAAHPELSGPYDAIIPMPLHPRRLRERGFNQALQAALPLAARSGAAIRPDILIRINDTHPQAGLSFAERKTNVRDIFVTAPATAGAELGGKRLLLVDDIATTCASLESAATTLLRAGAFSADVAVIARTPEKR